MSIPEVPGYLGAPAQSTLAEAWSRPDGSFPDELWPVDVLRSITPDPTGWLVVSEHYFTDNRHRGRGCVLVHPHDAEAALADTGWCGRDLGDASVWISADESVFDSGLEATERDARLEFFVQARTPVGATTPVVDVSLPFLWYWDAFPVADGWLYLNPARRRLEVQIVKSFRSATRPEYSSEVPRLRAAEAVAIGQLGPRRPSADDVCPSKDRGRDRASVPRDPSDPVVRGRAGGIRTHDLRSPRPTR